MREGKGIKEFAKRLNDGAPSGLVGLVAGKVKTRDLVVSSALGALIAVPLLINVGIAIGLAAVLAIGLGCGVLIRLRKWQVGAPRDSDDY